MISQKIYVMSIFNYITYQLTSFGTLVMKEKFFSFRLEGCLSGGRSGQFGTFYFLSRTDNFDDFLKDSYHMSKNNV